jgi:hypothetical protein
LYKKFSEINNAENKKKSYRMKGHHPIINIFHFVKQIISSSLSDHQIIFRMAILFEDSRLEIIFNLIFEILTWLLYLAINESLGLFEIEETENSLKTLKLSVDIFTFFEE